MFRLESLGKLTRLSPAQGLWVLEAALLLAWARFLTRFVPFSWWRGRLGTIGANGAPAALDEKDRAIALQVRRWVRRTAAHAPFQAPCLPQAMAARWMLARRGVASELHIGARPGNPVALHAWLLCGPLCLTGAGERQNFVAFAAAPSSLSRREAGSI